MKYSIEHITEYAYSEPASLSYNEVFLQIRNTPVQQVKQYAVDITPTPLKVLERVDFFGNVCRTYMVQQPHQKMRIRSNCIVETLKHPSLNPGASSDWQLTAQQLAEPATEEQLDASQYIYKSPLTVIDKEVTAYAAPSFPPGRPVLEGALELMTRIFTDFTYDKSATTVDTSVLQVLRKKRGVCQDFSHLCISALRGLGLAARYVSGYLETLPPPGKKKLVGSDASHAWLSVYTPEYGWVDLDPTNNMMPNEQHVIIGWGRDYGDITPVKGVVMGGGIHNLSVSVDMNQIK